jgi:hypothetical protein
LSKASQTWQNPDKPKKGIPPMFESDQSDLHDEIAELKQSAPAAAKPQTAVPDPSFYEAPESHLAESHVHADEGPLSAENPEKAKAKKKPFPFVIAGAGVLALFVLGLLLMSKPKKGDEPMPGDLGPGVSASSGLRGHLVTQWDGPTKTGRVQYQLRLEPLSPTQNSGFAMVNMKPAAPYSINMRLLDQSGFALCGKEVIFPFDPSKVAESEPANFPPGKKGEAARAAAQAARQADLERMQAAEADREKGKDMLQAQAGADGLITAVNAQGSLPCAADQYKRAYYWDFTTNFPTVDEQLASVDPKAAASAKREQEPDARGAAHKKAAPKKLPSAYYIQGDDRVMGFDPQKGELEATAGKSFTIVGTPEQAIAANWAHSYSLIHYKCDQHANCALSAAGGMSVVYGRINE